MFLRQPALSPSYFTIPPYPLFPSPSLPTSSFLHRLFLCTSTSPYLVVCPLSPPSRGCRYQDYLAQDPNTPVTVNTSDDTSVSGDPASRVTPLLPCRAVADPHHSLHPTHLRKRTFSLAMQLSLPNFNSLIFQTKKKLDMNYFA